MLSFTVDDAFQIIPGLTGHVRVTGRLGPPFPVEQQSGGQSDLLCLDYKASVATSPQQSTHETHAHFLYESNQLLKIFSLS